MRRSTEPLKPRFLYIVNSSGVAPKPVRRNKCPICVLLAIGPWKTSPNPPFCNHFAIATPPMAAAAPAPPIAARPATDTPINLRRETEAADGGNTAVTCKGTVGVPWASGVVGIDWAGINSCVASISICGSVGCGLIGLRGSVSSSSYISVSISISVGSIVPSKIIFLCLF